MSSASKVAILKKNVKGGLSLVLEDINDPTKVKTISFSNRRPTNRISMSFALSIFNDPNLMDMYKKGMFVVQNEQDFFREAEDQGIHFFDREDGKKGEEELVLEDVVYVTEDEILKLLKSKNTRALKQKIDEASIYLKSQILFITCQHVNDLPLSTIKLVEEALQTIIPQDNAED